MSAHLSPEEILQSILQNVHIGGNLTTGDITQILNLIVVIKQIDSFKPTEIPQNIPRSGTIKFVGRAEALERLHQMLQHNSQVVLAAIEGMGGVGKTELATQYALLHLLVSTYTGGICWLRARDENVGIQIVQFAQAKLELKPPEDWDLIHQVDFCWSRWHQGNVLVVLDDVNDYQKVEQYLPPQSPRFKVLITTRLQLDDLTEPSRITLDVLSELAAVELLEGWIGAEKIERELADAKELCQWLGYLPLALNLVGRYVKKRKLSLAEMLRRLKEKKLSHESLVRDSDDHTWALNIKRGVEAAFELSWEELSEAAKQLGCLLSLFALAAIPWLLVEDAVPDQDAEELEDARVELENLHLLTGGDTYRLHQLIREFLKNKQKNLASTDEKKSGFCEAMVEVAKKIPYTPTQNEITTLTPAIPHLTELAQNLTDVISNENLIWVFSHLGWFYEGQGLYALAELWFKQCVSVVQSRLGDEHPDVTLSFNNLAFLYYRQGRYSEAEPLYINALELRQRLLGDENRHVATSHNDLAELYRSQGRYSEAEPLYIKALELRQRLLGEEHPDVTLSFNNLALLYNSQGRYSEAEPLFIKALELRQRLLGEEHPWVATSYNDLAYLYYCQGRYTEAEPLFIKALELRQRLLGEEHPDIAQSFNNLALLYNSQRRYTEAKSLYIKALELKQRLLGEEHPWVATSYNDLAYLYYCQGQYTEAEPLYITALELRQRLLPEEHPDVTLSFNNLALLYNSQGRYSEAEPLFIKALEIASKSLGLDHPSTITIRENLKSLRDNYA
jgi:tetratricopeptide (TPR) repeat protein